MNMPSGEFGTILADPPWRFSNRTVRGSPERKNHYATMLLEDIKNLPIPPAKHLYLWVPNALLPAGLEVMATWGFEYKTNIVWCKTKHDGSIHGGGVGWYFRSASELCLFGVKGNLRTGAKGRTQTNVLLSGRREHSIYNIIDACSPGPYLELFARYHRPNWTSWGDQLD